MGKLKGRCRRMGVCTVSMPDARFHARRRGLDSTVGGVWTMQLNFKCNLMRFYINFLVKVQVLDFFRIHFESTLQK